MAITKENGVTLVTGQLRQYDSTSKEWSPTPISDLYRNNTTDLADDDSVTIVDDSDYCGFGVVSCLQQTEIVYFKFDNGLVTHLMSNGDVANADTDDNLCVYSSGSLVVVKNRLGSAQTILFDVKYALKVPA